ncbi:MAG: hypothetical protein ACYDB1_13070, partial [Acidiferrobacteraceae bacterium]
MRFRDFRRADTRPGQNMLNRASADPTMESGLRRTVGLVDNSTDRALPTGVVWISKDQQRTRPFHMVLNQDAKRVDCLTAHTGSLSLAKPWLRATALEVCRDRGVP